MKKLPNLSPEKRAALAEPLAGHLNDPESRVANRAVEALAALGQPAVTAVRKKLKDPDIYVRVSAAAALGQIGPAAQEAVPDLQEALRDPHPLVREEAVEALKKIGAAPPFFS